MLAGKMKLSHFLGLVGLGAVAVIGGAGWWWSNQPEPPPHSLPSIESKAPTAASTSTSTTSASPAPATGDYQADALSYAGRDLGSAKLKDVSAGMAYKINVYQDSGNTTANRLKIDLDRDEKWDEKWTFESNGSISRKVAPNDDEDYSLFESWNGSGWDGPPTEDEFPPPEPAADTPAQPTASLPPAEAEAMGWRHRPLAIDKVKDVSKGEPYKINIYQDKGHDQVTRLKIDLDRDDNWDQKWTFHDDGQISRKVAPSDDENYTIEQVWGSEGWVSAP